MSEKSTHGGKREGAGRKSTGKTEYLRTPVAQPWTDEQRAAVEWWEAWTPRDRLMYIVELWYDCGCKLPRGKR